jgi:stage II sporulation protein D
LADKEKTGFDAAADVRHQVYAGAGREDNAVWQAVDGTRGRVLADRKGGVFPAYFHSCCGGRTEDAKFVWPGGVHRGLVGVKDWGYCKRSPHYFWSSALAGAKFAGALKALGYKIHGGVDSAAVGEKSPSGRALSLRVEDRGGRRYLVSMVKLRSALGPDSLRSGKITRIKGKGRGFVFHGQGWGHGVGLCQWGARGMAEKGKGYKKILKHYFPRARLKKIRT